MATGLKAGLYQNDQSASYFPLTLPDPWFLAKYYVLKFLDTRKKNYEEKILRSMLSFRYGMSVSVSITLHILRSVEYLLQKKCWAKTGSNCIDKWMSQQGIFFFFFFFFFARKYIRTGPHINVLFHFLCFHFNLSCV